MTKERALGEQDAVSIADRLAESIVDASDDEITESMRAERKDVEATAEKVRHLLGAAVLTSTHGGARTSVNPFLAGNPFLQNYGRGRYPRDVHARGLSVLPTAAWGTSVPNSTARQLKASLTISLLALVVASAYALYLATTTFYLKGNGGEFVEREIRTLEKHVTAPREQQTGSLSHAPLTADPVNAAPLPEADDTRAQSSARLLQQLEQRERALTARIREIEAALPRSVVTVEPLFMVKLAGLWTEEELVEMKQRWATGCGIDVSSIEKVPGGYQFRSPGCAPGTFDQLEKPAVQAAPDAETRPN